MKQRLSFVFGPVLMFFGILLTALTGPKVHWAFPTMALLGTLMVLYLLITTLRGYKINTKKVKIFKEQWDRKKLLVIVQHSNNILLGKSYDILVHSILSMRKEYGLQDLSILRGDLEFCLETLKKERNHPVIVILETSQYIRWQVTDKVFSRGASLIYRFRGNTPEDLLNTITGSIKHWMTGKF